MSAQKIIERIKAMPREEPQTCAVNEPECNPKPEGAMPSVAEPVEPVKSEAKTPDWETIIKEVFDEHDELFRKLAE